MGIVRCLTIGDPHFKSNNIKECKTLIDRVCTIIDQLEKHDLKLDFIVCLGDLLNDHNKYEEASFNEAIRFMSELSKRYMTFLLVGNHDYRCNNQFLTDKHPYNALKKWGDMMIVVDSIKVYNIDDYEFIFAPYVPKGRFLEALNLYDMWDTADCIFAHQEFRGVQMGAMISNDGDEWDEDYPIVISGHVHTSQCIQNNIYYPGTPVQHSFSDTQNKRIWLCTFDNSQEKIFSYQKINLKLQQKRIVYLQPHELESFVPNENEQTKISIKCNDLQFKTLLKNPLYVKLTNTPNIKIVHTKECKIDVDIELFRKKKCTFHDNSYVSVLQKLVNDENNKYVTDVYKMLSKN